MKGKPRCILCDAHDFLFLPYSYSFKGRSIRIVRCRQCHLATLYPMLSPEEVLALYSSEYFDRDYHCGTSKGTYTEEVESMRSAFKSSLSHMARFRGEGTFLEIGCAGGAALAEARAFGYSTTGVELSQEMAEWGRTHLNLDIRIGSLVDQHFDDASFDVVFMGDVIEHLLYPKDDLREIHRILKPGGIIALAYPMELNHIVPRIRTMFHLPNESYQKPYHLFYYAYPTLARLLDICGFEAVLNRESKMVRRVPVSFFAIDAVNALFSKLTGKWGDRGFTIARVRK